MAGYIEGRDRTQSVLFPERLDDWIHDDSAVRVIDGFTEGLDLSTSGPLSASSAMPASAIVASVIALSIQGSRLEFAPQPYPESRSPPPEGRPPPRGNPFRATPYASRRAAKD